MTHTDQSRAGRVLHDLVLRMGEAERQGEEEILAPILDDALRFRRASGQVVNKSEFLHDLRNPENSLICLESEIEQVTVYETIAVVVLVVRATGTRGGQPFEGAFRNVRLFVSAATGDEDDWRCAMWLNARIGDVGCQVTGADTTP